MQNSHLFDNPRLNSLVPGTESLKILHVIRTLDPSWGGPREGVRHLTSQALARDYKPEIVTLDDPTASWISNYAARVHAVGSKRETYGYSTALDSWLSANLRRFDCVVVHGVWQYLSYAVWKVTRRIQVPYFVFTHGYLDPWFQKHYPLKHIKKAFYWKAVESKILRDAEAVLFTSQEEMLQAHGSFAPYRCNPRVVGYGVPPAPKSKKNKATVIQELTSSHSRLEGRHFILFLARIHVKKGVDLLLKAFAATRRLLPDTALIIAGTGDPSLTKDLKALAVDLGIQNEVIWPGPLYGEQKWDVMRAAESLILPSHQENFGIGVAESLSCGTPVLISNRVNIWREIDSEGAGLVKADDFTGTQELLTEWAGLAPGLKACMRTKAEQCFDRWFDITKTSDRFFDVLLQK
jgi:glycosyltransferase involved in cell wall biosynthesis